MNSSLILDSLTKSTDDNKTHVSMYPIKGSYFSSAETHEKFMNMYCDTMYTGNAVLGIAELSSNASPVLTDIDIKVPVDDDAKVSLDNLYDKEDVLKVIKMYHDCFTRFIKNPSDELYYCCVLEKEPRFSDDNKYIKHGFHLHFPSVFLNLFEHKNFILPSVVDAINEHFSTKYGYDRVFDEHVLNVAWLMYGSMKSASSQPYVLTKVYNKELNEISVRDAFKDYQIFGSDGGRIEMTKPVEYYLPRILSIKRNNRKMCSMSVDAITLADVPIPTGDIEEKRYEEAPIVVEGDVDNKEQASVSNIVKVRDLLQIIKTDNKTYMDWLKIGWAVYNICGSCEASLELWLEFSSRSEHYDKDGCIYQWRKMKDSNITIGTLAWYASNDNPKDYGKFKAKYGNKKLLYTALDGSHNSIAELLYADYGKHWVYSGLSWFFFNGAHWERKNEPLVLKSKLSKDIKARFSELITILKAEMNQYADNGNQQEAIRCECQMDRCKDVIDKLKNTGFKGAVMNESKEVFLVEQFEKTLDVDPDIIAFKNGIFDFKTYQFRCTTYNDRVSKCMPINYVEDMRHDDPRLIVLDDYLAKTFPDVSIKTYFLDVMCSVFHGGNRQKKLYVWTGEGDNGKSITQAIVHKLLGPYATDLPVQVITGKRSKAGTACPELARLGGGVRWADCFEPDNKDTTNVGMLKQLSGNDAFFARDLFQKGSEVSEITPMFKIALICNKAPAIVDGDKATWNRIRVIPFETEFADESKCPPTEEERLLKKIYPVDTMFSDKIPELLEPFAWMLVQRYRNLKGKPVFEPEKVQRATNEYKYRTDLLIRYCEDNYTYSPNEEDVVHIDTLYLGFKEWFETSTGLPKNACPSKIDVTERLSKIWGKTSQARTWKNRMFILQRQDN